VERTAVRGDVNRRHLHDPLAVGFGGEVQHRCCCCPGGRGDIGQHPVYRARLRGGREAFLEGLADEGVHVATE
jgi:hypothetical protein